MLDRPVLTEGTEEEDEEEEFFDPNHPLSVPRGPADAADWRATRPRRLHIARARMASA
jgi:hypothetical protein